MQRKNNTKNAVRAEISRSLLLRHSFDRAENHLQSNWRAIFSMIICFSDASDSRHRRHRQYDTSDIMISEDTSLSYSRSRPCSLDLVREASKSSAKGVTYGRRCSPPRVQWKHIGAISLLMLQVVSLPLVRAEQHSITWRDVSRKANEELRKYELVSAEQNYRRAIGMLTSAEPNSETILDLKLALAESMRRNHKLSEAKVILDEVEHSIAHKTVNDQLVLVRYWRRRAALQRDMNLHAEAASSFRKAFAQWKKLFPQGTKLYVDKALHLLNLLMELNVSEELLAQLIELHANFGRQNLPPRLRNKFKDCCSKLRLEAAKLSNAGRLKESAALLIPLSQVDECSNELLQCWETWLGSCIRMRNAPNLSAANNAIEETIVAAKKSRDLDVATELEIRIAQIEICEQLEGKSDPTGNELRKVIARFDPLTSSSQPDKTQLDYSSRHKLFEVLHRSTWHRFQQQNFDEFTLKLAQCTAALTSTPSEPSPPNESLLKMQASDHAEARYLLTLLHVRRKEPADAEKTLMSLSPILSRTHHDNYFERLARLRLRIGWEYLKKNQLAKAQEQVNLSEAALKALGTGFNAAPIQKLIDEIKGRLKEVSR